MKYYVRNVYNTSVILRFDNANAYHSFFKTHLRRHWADIYASRAYKEMRTSLKMVDRYDDVKGLKSKADLYELYLESYRDTVVHYIDDSTKECYR